MFLKPVSAQYYDEIRMNQVSDAGKGAYLYLDTPEEADHALGDDERFLTIMEVAARDVQLSITLPPGYSLEVFHGEEVSGDPSEVEPQHLSPGDAMLYHFVIADCDPGNHSGNDRFDFSVTWVDPITRETRIDVQSLTIDEMLAGAGPQLLKADAVVAYADALVVAPTLPQGEGIALIDDVIAQVESVYNNTSDPDMQEIAALLELYKSAL